MSQVEIMVNMYIKVKTSREFHQDYKSTKNLYESAKKCSLYIVWVKTMEQNTFVSENNFIKLHHYVINPKF